MNKQELIAALEKIPDDTIILVARDEEWNTLSELYALDESHAVTDMFEWHAIADEDLGEYEEEQIQNAVVLWG